MTLFLVLAGAVIFILLLILFVSYICFRKAFFVPCRKQTQNEVIETPEGKIYDEFRESMITWAKEVRDMPFEEMTITTFDGLILKGKYYEFSPNAPIELMFHGYRGTAERDLSGGVQRCFKLGRSALIVDQRCSGKSEGNVITFGIKEHKDCLAWVEYMIKRFGKDVKIILAGISMGAATVLMASGKDLPSNVIGVLADCGYSSPKEIINIVIRKMGIPPKLAYPFVRLGAALYGRFNLEETSPEEAVKKAKVPIIFFHGENDDFVPCYMSKKCFDLCNSKKMLVTIPKAGHGLSYPMDSKKYLDSLREFFGSDASYQKENI